MIILFTDMDLVDKDFSIIEAVVPLLLLAVMLILGFRAFRERLARFRGRFLRRNYVIVLGLTRISMQLARQLSAQGRRVAVIAPGRQRSEAELLRKKGVFVLIAEEINSDILLKAGLPNAETAIIATGGDEENLNLVELLKELKRHQFMRKRLRILVQVENVDTLSVMKDYLPPAGKQGSAEVLPFNEKQLAAQLVYDLNPPYQHLKGSARLGGEESICVIGANQSALFFLVENAILSQQAQKRRLKVHLIAPQAAEQVKRLQMKSPFLEDYLELLPLELHNETFHPDKSWDARLREIIPAIDAVYCFGDEDSQLFRIAQHFHQRMTVQTQNVSGVPFTVCLPETAKVLSLMSTDPHHHGESLFPAKDLNFHFVRMVSDTCTVKNLVDNRELSNQLAMAVNYFYAVKHEFGEVLEKEFRQKNTHQLLREIEEKIIAFRAKTDTPLAELEELVIRPIVAYTKQSDYKVRKHLGVQERWDALNERAKEANRYVVRHMNSKLHFLQGQNVKEISPEALEKNKAFELLAYMEHKRWSAERYAAGYAEGKYSSTATPAQRRLLKQTVKVHEKLIDYDDLDDFEMQKDRDIFLLIPVLQSIRFKFETV